MGWRTLYPLAGATALVPLAVWLSAADLPRKASAAPEPVAPIGQANGRVGSSSCSGRGCHGKVAPSGIEGSEYHTWANQDPHASAYLALFNCRSESIQQKLYESRPDTAYVPPYADALCMSCHGQPDSPKTATGLTDVDCASSASLAPVIGPSGVGCEDCHGPAGPWLDVHYRDGWREEYPEAAAAMQSLRPTLAKAEVCLRCHVGDGLDREVNHDLIAAGHPRLNFELVLYSDRMPQHWDRSITDAKRQSDGQPARDPAGEWAIGQLATLRACLDLLADRAGPPNPARTPPWPEFSEYACFACHHALVDEGLHYSRSSAVPGSPDWGSWVASMARPLIERTNGDLGASLDAVDQLMGQPLPDERRVAEEVRSLASGLGTWLPTFDEGAFLGDDLKALLRSIVDSPGRFEVATSNWDAATQLYLAMRALSRSQAMALASGSTVTDEQFGRVQAQFESLGRIQDALSFPGDHVDSPGSQGEPDPWSEDPRPLVDEIRALLLEMTKGASDPVRVGSPTTDP